MLDPAVTDELPADAETEGADATVMATVFEQPAEFVYVILTEPLATPVTTPALLTVALAVLEDTHGLLLAAVPDPVNVVVEPTHTVDDPVTVGAAVIVTFSVVWHPALSVYVIPAVPAETPVTTPPEVTVATEVDEEIHGLLLAAVPLPVSVVVLPTQALKVPEILAEQPTGVLVHAAPTEKSK